MQIVRVESGSGDYHVVCGRGACQQLSRIIGAQRDVTRVFVLTSPRVWKSCGRRITKALARVNFGAPILFDDSERAKNLQTVEKLCEALHRGGADRGSLLVAAGGGVVGDVAGFVAASYLRGVRLMHLPTTLVAQIDSSIGGKTGVNLRLGKNLVGAFYPPVSVIADPAFLESLPEAQFHSGLYEIVKYGVIGDAKLLAFLESNMTKILRRDASALAWITDRSIRAKARVVSKDEHESGLRQTLNFGHTFGHALETAGNYRRHLHGEAVGWGMLVATLLALATNRLNSTEAERIARVLMSVGALPSFQGIRAAKLLALMKGDKKSRAGQVRWVLPCAIGRVEWGIEVPDRLVGAAIAEAPEVARIARAEL